MMTGNNTDIIMSKELKLKTAVVVGLELIIAVIHIIGIRNYLSGQLYEYYTGYFSDIALPFGFYFLLCINDTRFPSLKKWYVKSLIIFCLASTAEILQFFGIPLLGRTFDPVDFVMYGIGVLLAAIVEKQLFERIFSFWILKEE